MDDNISQKRFSDVNQPLLCVKISQEILLKASFSKEQSIIETIRKKLKFLFKANVSVMKPRFRLLFLFIFQSCAWTEVHALREETWKMDHFGEFIKIEIEKNIAGLSEI